MAEIRAIFGEPVNDLFGLIGQGRRALCDEGLERMHNTTLHHREVVRLDIDRLQAIFDDLGYHAGETEICAVMEDIAACMTQAQADWQAGDLASLRGGAVGLETLADGIGMVVLSRIARDLAGLCVAYDDAALGAVMARLTRIGTKSLLAVWDEQDRSL